MSDEIRVVDPTAAEPEEPVAGLVERTAFRVDDRRLVALRIDESSWFRRKGAVYGWVCAGRGTVAGAGDERPTAVSADDFFRVPAGAARQYAAGSESLEALAVVDGDAAATAVDPPVTGDESAAVDVVGPEDLVPTVESPDLVRETPFPGGDVLPMRVRAAGGAAAGWHHHGDNAYFGYAVDGPSETEYGPAGERVARIEIGECFHVPRGLIHRDTNPTDETHAGIIWLCGGEPWVVNVDGPT
ncbi:MULTISPECIES: hypothetical protein [Natrialbaceae]|uniref:hypothetical protein n=1 Tax=Natrialbaceae TaxID=1644061 RepID=UPI00207CB67F|nr:hypothetical protein [Natronococcus sp. CG52]